MEVLEKLGPQFSNVTVEKVLSSNEEFKDPVHKAPLDALVQLCQSFGFNVCYYLEDAKPTPQDQDGMPTFNAFRFLYVQTRKESFLAALKVITLGETKDFRVLGSD